MAPVFAVDTVDAFADRVRAMMHAREPMVATIIMMATAFAFVAEVFTLAGAAMRFVTGVDRRK